MAPLSENEKKQIRRCCVYPKVALVALVMAFVTCLMLVPLEMIDDLVFHHKGFQDTGLNVILALVAVNLVVSRGLLLLAPPSQVWHARQAVARDAGEARRLAAGD